MKGEYQFVAKFFFEDYEEAQEVRDRIKGFTYDVSDTVKKRVSDVLKSEERRERILKEIYTQSARHNGAKISSGTVYRLIKKKFPISQHSLYRDITFLIMQGKLRAEKVRGGARGTTTHLFVVNK